MTAQEQQRNSESIAGSAAEPEVDTSDADAALSEAEVAQVKSHIAEALGVASAVAHDYSGASLYYDASTMASLNPFSLVGLCLCLVAFVFGPACP